MSSDERGQRSAPQAASSDGAGLAGASNARDVGATSAEERVRPAPADGSLSFASPVGATLLGVYAWYATAALFGPFSEMAEDVGKLLLSVLLVLALSMVHELGHVVAGWLAGVDFRSLTIGPLTVVRSKSGCRVRPNSHWVRFAGCVERDFSGGRPQAGRLIASALGGPGANLLLAAVLFALGAHGGLIDDFAVWSLLFGLMNLVPIRHGGQTSDGGLVVALWRARR